MPPHKREVEPEKVRKPFGRPSTYIEGNDEVIYTEYGIHKIHKIRNTEYGIRNTEYGIRDALDTLSRTNGRESAQTILLDALRTAAEQSYFWTPEWQAGEREAEQDLAEGRVETFDTMEGMLDFLDAQ